MAGLWAIRSPGHGRFVACRRHGGARAGRQQLAAAAKMMKMNADNAASIVQVIEAAQKNLGQLADAAAALGENLDISV
jgi:hypothetical protein